MDRPTDRAAAGDPLTGQAAAGHPTGPAAGHPTGPAAVEGLPTGQAPVGETVGRAILPHRHLVAMESLLHRNNKKHLCDKKNHVQKLNKNRDNRHLALKTFVYF